MNDFINDISKSRNRDFCPRKSGKGEMLVSYQGWGGGEWGGALNGCRNITGGSTPWRIPCTVNFEQILHDFQAPFRWSLNISLPGAYYGLGK